MADRKIVFFKNYIKSQIASLRDSLGEARYNLYLATVDSIEDYEELKELAELELQIEYAKYMENNVLKPLKDSGRDLKSLKGTTEEVKESPILETDDLDEEEIDDDDRLRLFAMMQLEMEQSIAESEIYTGEDNIEIEDVGED